MLLTPVLKSLFFQLYAKRGALKLGILCFSSCEPFLAFVLNSIKRAFTLWPSYPGVRSFLSEYKREGDGYLIDVTRTPEGLSGMVYIACEPSTFTPRRYAGCEVFFAGAFRLEWYDWMLHALVIWQRGQGFLLRLFVHIPRGNEQKTP